MGVIIAEQLYCSAGWLTSNNGNKGIYSIRATYVSDLVVPDLVNTLCGDLDRKRQLCRSRSPLCRLPRPTLNNPESQNPYFIMAQGSKVHKNPREIVTTSKLCYRYVCNIRYIFLNLDPFIYALFQHVFLFQHVDEENSYLCGYLKIKGLTEEFPTLTTFFDGEIISKKYPFLTRKWDADEDVDKKHWVGIYLKNITEVELFFLGYAYHNGLILFFRANLTHFASTPKHLILIPLITMH